MFQVNVVCSRCGKEKDVDAKDFCFDPEKVAGEAEYYDVGNGNHMCETCHLLLESLKQEMAKTVSDFMLGKGG